MHYFRYLLFVALAALAVRAAPAAENPTPPLDTAKLQKWIAELDSDRFLTREAATANLVAAGDAAIEPVSNVVSRGSVEVAIRAVYVLRELAASTNAHTSDAAEEALRKMAQSKVTVAASRAQTALDALADLRQERATGVLRGLGAKIETQPIAFGVAGAEEIVTVQIDDDWRGTPADLKFLGYMLEARQLTLVGPKVTDDALVQAAKLTNLNIVMLKRTSVTEAGFAHLKGLPSLLQVSVFYSPLGDAMVEHFQAMKTVRLMRFYGTKLSKEGQAKLETALAGAKIDVRRGGFLGIGPAPNVLGDGLFVGHVVENSAADKAGIEEGDILVQFDGKRVQNFEGLTALIGEHIPGDKVSVVVERDGETLRKEVELGEWDVSRLNP